jgi:hypothetical protein
MTSTGLDEASSTRQSTVAREPLAQASRTCARCGVSITDYRRQAIYCGGPCRAAASRLRSAVETPADPALDREAARPNETAQNRTPGAGASI